jgi:hypothetical protein
MMVVRDKLFVDPARGRSVETKVEFVEESK